MEHGKRKTVTTMEVIKLSSGKANFCTDSN